MAEMRLIELSGIANSFMALKHHIAKFKALYI